MRLSIHHKYLASVVAFLFIILFCEIGTAQTLNLKWTAREDLNILLPASVRVYETNGLLADSARVRAMYATIDLRDRNLRLRAIGSNTRRETTWDTYARHNAILAINGGYFAATKSESLLVSDGELVASGPTKFTRGAFGLENRKPQIVWPFAIDSTASLYTLANPVDMQKEGSALKKAKAWHPSLAVGAGPVLMKNGKIRDTSLEEGFGGSHLLRHPRSAIGYKDEHTLIMMVVDGRQQSSKGVTIKELAQLMLEAGCFEAVNLDGGGSSAMVAADEIVNVPVDIPNGNRQSLRKNASALVLTQEIPSMEKKMIVIDTDTELYEERGIWKNTNHANFYGRTPSREAVATPLNRAIYRFATIAPDSFQLAAWWTVNEKNTTRATYVLHHGTKIDSLHVDQTSISFNGRWSVFGNYLIGPDDYLEVIGQGDGKVTTDAIRLVGIGTLKTQPARGDLRIAVISDLNSGLGSATYEWQVDSILQRIPKTWKPDLVLCGGDMVAGMGVSDTSTLTKMWNGFDEHIAKPLRDAKIPFAFTIGNHDGLRSYPAERKAISNYWESPAHPTGLTFVDKSHFPHYYSFRASDAFFISWDASSSVITEENLQWAKNQLNSEEAKRAKQRFVVGHLPIFSVAQERDSKGNVLENADALRSLLEQHHVKVYISGHQHAYYPGKRGNVQFLNLGAAGSGARRWLTSDKQPVNTVTIMDVFYDRDTIVYTTYDIKHRDALEMTVFDHHALPSSITGVNGFLVRNDIAKEDNLKGNFMPIATVTQPNRKYGSAAVAFNGNKITIRGDFNLDGKLLNTNDAITLALGKHMETGQAIFTLPAKSKNKKAGTFSSVFDVREDGMAELMSAGGYYISIRTDKFPNGEVRAQLYPARNASPELPVITSHHARNTYGIRNIKGLYKFSWSPSHDRDGDQISYCYQLASDSLFNSIVMQSQTGRVNFLKKTEAEIYTLINSRSTGASTFYHRVIASDGRNVAVSKTRALHLIKSDEPLTELVELDPEHYAAEGRIANAEGQGSGALWDKENKLWLADYGGALYAKLKDGTDASFSPLRSVTINTKTYSLKPINGIGLDRDGNILVGSNRFLLKINATTGEGIAVWEAPEGKRAITSPRANDKGEIYAMSLFAEDPNYVLKQSTSSPGTFDLVRTISLPQRILTRTFDMSSDGLHLYFPDPGSAFIQSFTSTDGITYKRNEDIISVEAGCNAIAVFGNTLFAAVRASGVSGSTLHLRDEKEKVMWTLPLPELDGAEARGMAVSPDLDTIIICVWDKGGGFYRYTRR